MQQLLCDLGSDVPVAYLADEKSNDNALSVLKHRGLCVLVRPKFVATIADLWLQPLDDVVQFLTEWLTARTGKS